MKIDNSRTSQSDFLSVIDDWMKLERLDRVEELLPNIKKYKIELTEPEIRHVVVIRIVLENRNGV